MASPLTKTDISNIRKTIAMLREVEQDLQTAMAAGVDVGELVARQVHLQNALQQMHDAYASQVEGKK